MLKVRRTRKNRGLLRGRAVRAVGWLRSRWAAVQARWRSPPIGILVADRQKRRALKRDIRAALGRLRRLLGPSWFPHFAVVVQQVVQTDRQLAGCCQISQLEDGRRFALIRLALQVNGRPVSIDELLAVLSDQCIGLVTQEGGARSVVVPVDLEPELEGVPRLTLLPSDPLLGRKNGSDDPVA